MPPRAKKESFKKGDKVEAKWSGSNVFYPATVLESSARQYKVQFEDGSISSLKMSDVKALAVKTEHEPRKTRSRSRSAGRSPGRKRSTSKSPSRTATKAEKKVPLPKSKSVQTKSKSNHSEIMTSQPSSSTENISLKLQTINVASSTSLSSVTSSIFTNSTKEKVVYSEVVEQESKREKDQDSALSLRTSARIAALQTVKAASASEKERLAPFSKGDLRKRYSADEDSDEESEDEVDKGTSKGAQDQFSFVSFSMVILKIFYLLMPVLFFCFACTKKQCTVYDVPPVYTGWKQFANDVKYPLLIIPNFHLLLCMLARIPIGSQYQVTKHVSKETKAQNYRMNGFYQLLLTATALVTAVYFAESYMNFSYLRIKPIIISLVIYSMLWSLALYFYGLLRTHDPNEKKPYHRAGFLGNFYFGHEVNPWLFGREDVKTRFIQFGLIGLALLELSFLMKFFLVHKSFPIPLILASSMHLLFIAEYFWREECMLNSAMYSDEGVGFGFVAGIGSVIPGFLILQVVYLINYWEKIHLPYWCSAAIAVLFLCGLYIHDSSISLKHQFRKNPYAPSMSRVTSIPTSKKKRLITSGLWGIVRHPNYLGLLIMVIACSLPCGFTHALPHMPLLFFVGLLALRTLKVEVLCKNMYGPAWENYMEKVPYRVIPYIF